MESLSALGLAANVLQFVQLASTLLGRTRAIYISAGGVSESQELEELYTKLSQMSHDIESGIEGGQGVTRLSASRTNLRNLATDCKFECDRLVEVVAKLKVNASSKHRLMDSLRSALSELMKRDEMAKMKERIGVYENAMVLELCAISNEHTAILSDQIHCLRLENAQWRLSRADQLRSLELSYGQITTTATFVKTHDNPPEALWQSESFSNLTTILPQVMLKAREQEMEHAILTSLDYEYRPVRHRRIPEAHRSTCEWIYSDIPTSPSSGKDSVVSFESWLEKGHGHFWITGKPGSGKSTMMKFIAGHSKTSASLNNWAAPDKAIIAAHYFWSPGTLMQQSQEGLLRSIVRDVFSTVPDLIAVLCRDRWDLDASLSDLREKAWELSQLRSIIRALGTRDDLPIQAKYCFFIDGLDEFKGDHEGDHQDICTTLLELAISSRVKICISSRPWNVFIHSFGQDLTKKLSVDQLTQNDIMTYTSDRLRKHPRWSTFCSDQAVADSLISDIVDRSEGVFLWVFLVTKVLRTGIDNGDPVSELRERLDKVPDDLGEFFKQILESVDSHYHCKMAGFLRISLAALEPLPDIVYGLHDEEYKNIKYFLEGETGALAGPALEVFNNRIRERLNATTMGLLEVHATGVDVLHRTLKDFLATEEMMRFLSERSKKGFDPNISIARAFVAWIKRGRFPRKVIRKKSGVYEPNPLVQNVRQALDYVSMADTKDTNAVEKLLGELDYTLELMFWKQSPKFEEFARLSGNYRRLFCESVISTDLSAFVSTMLERDSTYLDILEISPLQFILEAEGTHSSSMIKAILEHGFSPNDPRKSSLPNSDESIWTNFMSTLARKITDHLGSQDTMTFQNIVNGGVLSILLRYNADPNTMTVYQYNEPRIPAWASFLLLALQACRGSKTVSRYIEDLNSFFLAGADINLMLVKGLGPSPWDRFYEFLRNLSQEVQAKCVPSQYLRFTSQIINELAKWARTSDGLPWDNVQPFLSKIYIPSLVRPLLNTIKGNRE